MATTVASSVNSMTRGRAWTSLVLGVLIFLVPFAFAATPADGYTSFAWNNYIVGVAVVILAGVAIWAAANNVAILGWTEGLNALLGIWTVISPFVFGRTTNAMYSNVVLGIVLLVVAGWDAYVAFTGGSRTTMRRGRAI